MTHKLLHLCRHDSVLTFVQKNIFNLFVISYNLTIHMFRLGGAGLLQKVIISN